jgi:BirA family biotin operon repressor/biotin-[acetyl-CoA-carboxylase] ligase
MKFEVIHIDETDSTNRWLRDNPPLFGNNPALLNNNPALLKNKGRLLRKGCPVVVAEYQTAGRGCGTNQWESERGKNLTFSMLIHPSDVPAAKQFILSMANALALKRTLDDYVDGIKIKWPNDIYWHDRKICGTLIETTLQGSRIQDCIIGTGININQRAFLSDAPNPVSLCQILGHEVDREEVLEKVLNYSDDYMLAVDQGLWEDIRASYRAHLYRLEESHDFIISGQRVCCKLVGVTDDGHLRLLHDHTPTDYAFKEVQFCL